jgi:hypothetical protein
VHDCIHGAVPTLLVYVLHRAHTLDSVATGCGVGGVCVLVAT